MMLGLEEERVGRVGHKGGKGDTSGIAPPFLPSLLLLRPKPALLWLLAARPPPTGSDPQSSLGGRTGEMPATRAVTQEEPCDARTRSD